MTMIEQIWKWFRRRTKKRVCVDFNGSYGDLLRILQSLPDECLDKPVIIYDGEIDKQYMKDGISYPSPNGEEYREVRSIGFTGPGCKKLGADNMLLYVGD